MTDVLYPSPPQLSSFFFFTGHWDGFCHHPLLLHARRKNYCYSFSIFEFIEGLLGINHRPGYEAAQRLFCYQVDRPHPSSGYLGILAPLAFLLTAEALTRVINEDDDIEGIIVNGAELKISQFADDTQLLAADYNSLTRSLSWVERYKIRGSLVRQTQRPKVRGT